MSGFPQLALVTGEDKDTVSANAGAIVGQWLERFEAALAAELLDLEALFLKDGWLKDGLALSWDQRTLQGISTISQFLGEHRAAHLLFNLKFSQKPQLRPILREMGPMVWLESGFEFETKIGQGHGVVRLANTGLGEWKAWILFVTLEELFGHPRGIALNRRRFRQEPVPVLDEPGEKTEPTVVIIGAGHCGLSMAACLQDLGVSTLVIDRGQRVGDSWRKRYKGLTLHSPNWGDHLPFLDFPSNWPVFPDKNQLADFLEFYARTLDLQVWLETEFQTAHYDDKSAQWTVETVTTDNRKKRRSLHPRHLVYAGNAHVLTHPNIPTWPGQDEFRGQLYHATEHADATAMPGVRDKKVVVIGSNTTAHDICMDFSNAGADVTMVQRGSTFVVSSEAAARIVIPPPEEGLTSDDFIFNLRSFPTPVVFGMVAAQMPHILAHDAKIVAELDRTEFTVDKGESGETFLSRAMRTRGGFYINDGASDAIADGRIHVLRSPKGVARLTPGGLVLADDRAVDADIIVLATSWKMFEDVVGDVMGKDVARRTSGRWGLDQEGEQASVYRPTGHPGFWIAISNLAGSRVGAPLLALQIKAIEEGLNAA